MMDEEHEHLQQAITQLYAIFAHYPAQSAMWACSCCVKPEEILALTGVPLRSLDRSDLERYSFKAMSTWGKSEDYRHFLPRLLELCVLEPGSYSINMEAICRKLAYAHWEEWPQEEEQAITTFFLAFWKLLLVHDYYIFRCSANEFFEALGQILEDFSPFLRAWGEQSKNAYALNALASFVNENGGALGAGGTLSWPIGSSSAQQQLVDWLFEPETQQWLEDGFFDSEDPAIAEQLAIAADTLFYLKQAGW